MFCPGRKHLSDSFSRLNRTCLTYIDSWFFTHLNLFRVQCTQIYQCIYGLAINHALIEIWIIATKMSRITRASPLKAFDVFLTGDGDPSL